MVRGPMKIVLLVGGVLLTLAGLALCALPGPGIPLVIAGLAMLGQVIPAVKKLEEKARKRMQLAINNRKPTHPPATMKSTEKPTLS
jgi:hypothetical protein